MYLVYFAYITWQYRVPLKFYHSTFRRMFQPKLCENGQVGLRWVWPVLLTCSSTFFQNRHWKLGHRSSICWSYLGLYRDYSLDHIFFRNKTFLFFKIESWNLQHLFEKKMWNLTKFQHNQTTDRKIENKNCLNELNELKFCEVSRNFFWNKCFSFLSWKTKKFYS